jgi:hypothetical protein
MLIQEEVEMLCTAVVYMVALSNDPSNRTQRYYECDIRPGLHTANFSTDYPPRRYTQFANL